MKHMKKFGDAAKDQEPVKTLAEIHEENRQVVIALSGGPVERKAEGGP